MSARRLTRRSGIGDAQHIVGRDHTDGVAFEFTIAAGRYRDEMRGLLEQLLDLADPLGVTLSVVAGGASGVHRARVAQDRDGARAMPPLRLER